jgi:hypothetical protein
MIVLVVESHGAVLGLTGIMLLAIGIHRQAVQPNWQAEKRLRQGFEFGSESDTCREFDFDPSQPSERPGDVDVTLLGNSKRDSKAPASGSRTVHHWLQQGLHQ